MLLYSSSALATWLAKLMPLLLLPCTCTHAYSEPWVDVDPTATTLGSFVKNPAQVEPVQIKALLEASASAYRSSIMATSRTSPAVSKCEPQQPALVWRIALACLLACLCTVWVSAKKCAMQTLCVRQCLHGSCAQSS